jgi:hypothetical protein
VVHEHPPRDDSGPVSSCVLRAIGLVIAAACFAACSGGGTHTQEPAPQVTRSWQLGMATLPPVPTVEAVLAGIELWSPHAELAAFHEELPWNDLLAGMSPAAILARDKVALVAHLRSKGLGIAFTADLTDGLSRAFEAPQLRALGRSLAEPAVQQLARDYVLAVDQLLQPELLGLAAETNLVRVAAPTWLYDAVVATSNAMAADLAASSSQAQLFFSVQVETAWGWGTGGNFVGIAADLQDFRFAQALGLSSYPYFLHASPDAMPDDYLRRPADATSLPVLVTEGGWSSAAVGVGN